MTHNQSTTSDYDNHSVDQQYIQSQHITRVTSTPYTENNLTYDQHTMKSDPYIYITGTLSVIQEPGPVLIKLVDRNGQELDVQTAYAPLVINFVKSTLNGIKIYSTRKGTIYSTITDSSLVPPDRSNDVSAFQVISGPPPTTHGHMYYYDSFELAPVGNEPTDCDQVAIYNSSPMAERWKPNGGTQTHDNTYPYDGKYYMDLTTGATTGNSAGMMKCVRLPASERFEIECAFAIGHPSTIATLDNIDFRIVTYDGTTELDGRYHYLGNTDLKWQIFNTSVAYEDLSGGTFDMKEMTNTSPDWHKLRMGFDMGNQVYTYLKIDDLRLDIDPIGLGIRSSASDDEPHITMIISTTTALDAAMHILVDRVIVREYV